MKRGKALWSSTESRCCTHADRTDIPECSYASLGREWRALLPHSSATTKIAEPRAFSERSSTKCEKSYTGSLHSMHSSGNFPSSHLEDLLPLHETVTVFCAPCTQLSPSRYGVLCKLASADQQTTTACNKSNTPC